ncbi:MAG TPA: hypothetical protein VGW38_25575 [Chloroflexota bacterium]|nr:hypothetical protein [Chloroflexota bacterium]
MLGLVLHHIGGRDQRRQDDAVLAAIHHIMVVVPKGGFAPLRHRAGIGVGPAHYLVGEPPVPFGSRLFWVPPARVQ